MYLNTLAQTDGGKKEAYCWSGLRKQTHHEVIRVNREAFIFAESLWETTWGWVHQKITCCSSWILSLASVVACCGRHVIPNSCLIAKGVNTESELDLLRMTHVGHQVGP